MNVVAYFLPGVPNNAGEDGGGMIPATYKSFSIQLDNVVGRCFRRIWLTCTGALVLLTGAGDATAGTNVEKNEPISIYIAYAI